MSPGPSFPRPLVSVVELADALGVSIYTVHYHIREGHIPTEMEHLGGMARRVIERETAEAIVANYRRNKTWTT